jgi:hypothetical protein
VNGVVEKSDGTTEKAAKDFRDDQPQRGDHGPAQHRCAHRSMSVAVPVIMGMVMGVDMRFSVHRHIVRGWGAECSPRHAPVSGKYDNTPLRIR